jgi:hypothetical protein
MSFVLFVSLSFFPYLPNLSLSFAEQSCFASTTTVGRWFLFAGKYFSMAYLWMAGSVGVAPQILRHKL